MQWPGRIGTWPCVAEPHHVYAALAPAPGKNFDAATAPALAPAPTYSRPKFLKGVKVNISSDILFSSYSV
jgi:hypothetical protein